MTITCNFVNLIVSAEYIFDKKEGVIWYILLEPI